MDKDSLRSQILSRRKLLSAAANRDYSNIIQKKILSLVENQSRENMLVYLPINGEVDTSFLINFYSQNKKRLFLPKFKDSYWSVAEFTDAKMVECGPFGTLQPSGKISRQEIDLAIVPGVAFSTKGTRLGYGKGVYDRLLEKSNAIKVGLAFDFQIAEVEGKAHDILMDLVVTEKRIIKTI